MIGDLKPYPQMQDSGHPWLGEVPVHWQVKKLRHLLTPVAMRNRPDLPLLSVVREKGVILRDISSKDENHNVIPEDLTNYKVVRSGQFVMNKMKAWQGSYGISDFEGIVSPAYFVFDLHELNGEFMNWAIRSKAFVPFFGRASDGVRIGQWDLSQTQMKEIPFAIPSPKEQEAIVGYLNRVNQRIQHAIRAKQKMIALFNEQKQAIIQRAVTRGLDQGARFKQSGVEWLGEVPEGWKVVRLGRFIELITGYPFKSEGFTEDQSDVRLLRGVNISPGNVRWGDVVYWPFDERQLYADFELRLGDIVLGMDRPLIQSGVRVAEVGPSDVPSLLLQRVARIRPHRDLKPEFLLNLLSGKAFSDYLAPIFTGISVPHLSPEQIRSFRFAMPEVDEQERILAVTSAATEEIRTAITRIQGELDLLSEYRIRLIVDVVTGKLDVRAGSASLPDDLCGVDELEPAGAEDIVARDISELAPVSKDVAV